MGFWKAIGRAIREDEKHARKIALEGEKYAKKIALEGYKASLRKKPNYVCKDCHYGWTSRKDIGSSPYCPRCHSKSIIKVDTG